MKDFSHKYLYCKECGLKFGLNYVCFKGVNVFHKICFKFIEVDFSGNILCWLLTRALFLGWFKGSGVKLLWGGKKSKNSNWPEAVKGLNRQVFSEEKLDDFICEKEPFLYRVRSYSGKKFIDIKFICQTMAGSVLNRP